MSKHEGMMVLDTDNMIVRQSIQKKIESKGGAHFFNIKCGDNDEAQYHVVSAKADPNIIRVSVAIPCFGELASHGMTEALEAKYPGMVVTPENEYDATVQADISDLGGRTPEEITKDLASLKRNVMAVPLEKYFNALLSGESLEPATINYRQREQLFLVPKGDRVQVVISLNYSDTVENAMASVFAQELDEDHKVFNQPILSFKPTDNRPTSLDACSGVKDPGPGDIGYVTIGVTGKELKSPAQMENTVNMILGLRTYLDYHLKASKSKLMSLMRQSTVKLLKAKARCMTKGKVVSTATNL